MVQPRNRAVPALDLAVVGSVTLFACFGVWTEQHYGPHPQPWPPGAYLLTVAAALPLLLRRTRPVLASALCLACIAAYHFAGYPGLAPAVLVFLVCAGLPMYAARYGLALGLLAALLVWLIPTLPPHRVAWYGLDVSMPAVAYAASAIVGHFARRRQLEHEARVRQEAAAAEERTGRRLAEERLRIARELHDVLAHTIAVVAIQSSVAIDALDADESPAAREAMLQVRGAARQAMPELRAALDMLRGGDTVRGSFGESPDSSGSAESGALPDARPQPGLADLPDLVRQLRESGLEVELDTDGLDTGAPGSAADLPPLLQLTAYRIVQEALTNTLRHAHASRATVVLRRRDGWLLVEVTDDGQGPVAEQQALGFGLLGMRERAEALGGRVETGPRPERSGFLVRAELPWETG
ncbi:sensor histidine kinase [Streptacidiphilus fuscans]|uniref:histidine kinase n=1 Tax=Streptacidiphilus fuscans TaxID=2789292 RepID=A0A931BGA4_9ACTN|nr:sensor histidine kinase [Streptacidiphilus fuscans]MBF9073613.1 sensor histidine kinase [Streptacidiphilus fuscans]